ncbi:MAG: carboxypeptidase-like regulatory domain-containing protein, partial [Vicinamibacterales bacterium]
MGTPLGVSETAVVRGTRAVLAALLLGLSGVAAGVAAAQLDDTASGPQPTRVTLIAAATTGVITGQVLDERGQPLYGVVVSAMGGSASFAISDRVGQYTLRALTPGPYLVRAHLDGYLPARNTIVNVRPSSRTVSTFTLRRLASAANPRVATAGVGVTDAADAKSGERDESETAWRLRHLKRSILKETTLAEVPAGNDFFLTDSLQLIGRAVESSARMASALFTSPLQGQVNLFTTGAFDNPGQLLHL